MIHDGFQNLSIIESLKWSLVPFPTNTDKTRMTWDSFWLLSSNVLNDHKTRKISPWEGPRLHQSSHLEIVVPLHKTERAWLNLDVLPAFASASSLLVPALHCFPLDFDPPERARPCPQSTELQNATNYVSGRPRRSEMYREEIWWAPRQGLGFVRIRGFGLGKWQNVGGGVNVTKMCLKPEEKWLGP